MHNVGYSPTDYKVGDFVLLLGDQRKPFTWNQRTYAGVIHSISGYYRVGQITEILPGIDYKGQEVQRVFKVSVGDGHGGRREERRSYMTVAPLLI